MKIERSWKYTVGRYDIRNEVSGYATKDAQEWFAECFAEYMVSDEPRPVAAKFGEMLEELLKGVK